MKRLLSHQKLSSLRKEVIEHEPPNHFFILPAASPLCQERRGTTPKTERLEKNRVLMLLADADHRWFSTHSGKFEYLQHLDFVAEHIAKNYYKNGGGKRLTIRRS